MYSWSSTGFHHYLHTSWPRWSSGTVRVWIMSTLHVQQPNGPKVMPNLQIATAKFSSFCWRSEKSEGNPPYRCLTGQLSDHRLWNWITQQQRKEFRNVLCERSRGSAALSLSRVDSTSGNEYQNLFYIFILFFFLNPCADEVSSIRLRLQQSAA